MNAVVLKKYFRENLDPVFLLDLAPTGETAFESVSPHRCGADIYTATVTFREDAVELCWHVRGPKKDANVC